MYRFTELRGLGRACLLGVLLGVPGIGRSGPEAQPGSQVAVVSGTAKAINYRNLTGSTEIGFHGTVLLPQAKGVAKVQNRAGAMSIKARFSRMGPATRFGAEYLTYVLWAVTPAGRPVNLGEVIVRKSGKAELAAHTSLSTFGLIVTAEPHFAVSQVSSLVVMENALTQGSRGQVEEVEARFERLPRGSCLVQGSPAARPHAVPDRKVHPYVLQAFNAFETARAEGAEAYAHEAFQKAAELMSQLEAEKKKWKKPAIVLARQLVQQAEDARLVALRNRDLERQEQERQAADQARMEAEAARAETDRTRSQAETAREEAERARIQAQDVAERARIQAEDVARRAKEQATRQVGAEKLAMRQKLREQLNRLLETRETPHGVVVSMSDLLFPAGKASLLPATREKLAKVAGVVLAYPGVMVSVEGHADGTGSDLFNRRLSLRRAQGVKGFLVGQGVDPGAVTAQGYGSDRPLASNETRAGRQQNRRVELVLTGGGIGF